MKNSGKTHKNKSHEARGLYVMQNSPNSQESLCRRLSPSFDTKANPESNFAVLLACRFTGGVKMWNLNTAEEQSLALRLSSTL